MPSRLMRLAYVEIKSALSVGTIPSQEIGKLRTWAVSPLESLTMKVPIA